MLKKLKGKYAYHNDIAILKTKKNINFDENIAPICLPKPKAKFQECFISGWGSTLPCKLFLK